MLKTIQATGLPFAEVPGFPSTQSSTSVKLPGVQGLRVDILAPGAPLRHIIQIPELSWAAQAIPHYDYLLADPVPATLLARHEACFALIRECVATLSVPDNAPSQNK